MIYLAYQKNMADNLEPYPIYMWQGVFQKAAAAF